MKFIVKNSVSNHGCIDICSESGNLVFKPPDGAYNEILIQTIKVETKRKGVGSKLIDKLKDVAREDYSSVAIRVMDISPLDTEISMEALIGFYAKNGFKITELDDSLVEGIFIF